MRRQVDASVQERPPGAAGASGASPSASGVPYPLSGGRCWPEWICVTSSAAPTGSGGAVRRGLDGRTVAAASRCAPERIAPAVNPALRPSHCPSSRFGDGPSRSRPRSDPDHDRASGKLRWKVIASHREPPRPTEVVNGTRPHQRSPSGLSRSRLVRRYGCPTEHLAGRSDTLQSDHAFAATAAARPWIVRSGSCGARCGA